MNAQHRFHERETHPLDFVDEVLVECPRCGGCAVHRPIGDVDGTPGALLFAPRRLSCGTCGYSKDWARDGLARHSTRGPVDDYFDLPLWLVESCCGKTIWVYNERHLAFLEGYLGARLRDRSKNEVGAWQNESLASRLPAWMKSAANRDDVLRALSRLRKKLPLRT